MPEAIVAYIPVIQQSYIKLLQKYPQARLYILDQDVLADFDYLRKDIRALKPKQAATALQAFKLVESVKLANKKSLRQLKETSVILPQDDLAAQLIETYFEGKTIIKEAVFLRWDRDNTTTNQDVLPDKSLPAGDFENKLIKLLYHEAAQATSWWRRVGAAIVKDGKVILSEHNRNMPTQFSAAVDGDPRSTVRRGVGIEFTNDAHAEATMIAKAAGQGLALAGADIYVDTFPCPKCAKDIVNAGLKRVYFISGYAVTDAQAILKAADIEVVKLITPLQPAKGSEAVPYPEKKTTP